MKTTFLFVFLLFTLPGYCQYGLEVHDVASKELDILHMCPKMDSIQQNQLILDSLYTPYKEFWDGYIGGGENLSDWLRENIFTLSQWMEKDKMIRRSALQMSFRKISNGMKKLTGYDVTGTWYIVYGPAWTDLGGLGDFAMLLDLAHPSNSSPERITRMLPHEFTHQIMTRVNHYQDSTALTPIIAEGFAVWMNQKYWKKRYTLADNLGYTQAELDLCNEKLEAIKSLFSKYKDSVNPDIINVFRNRNEKVNEKLPGAIGYYIGYKIVESYVGVNGPQSWKDIFILSPREVLQKSRFED